MRVTTNTINPLAIGARHIKTTMTFYITPVRKTIIKMQKKEEYCQGHGAKEFIVGKDVNYYSYDGEENGGSLLKQKSQAELPCDSAILLYVYHIQSREQNQQNKTISTHSFS